MDPRIVIAISFCHRLAFFCVCFIGLLAINADSLAQTGAVRRYVDDNVLISSQDPSLAIAVDEPFHYVGKHAITIADTAAGERYVFVDTEDTRVRRLFIVQFEGFLPGVNDEFRYDLSNSPVVADYPFRSNGYAFDLAESVAANAGGESAATHEFLSAAGYSLPEQWMMWRSLTVADEERRKEMILFYVEDVASVAKSLIDLYKNDAATQVWIDIQGDLEVRANRSFKLTTLDESGLPVYKNWSSIPNRFMR